jgi:DHA3 family macrolide efflux protein-like MFS transporter
MDAVGALIACITLAVNRIPDVRMAHEDRTGIIPEMIDGFKAVRDCRGLTLFFVFITLGSVAFMPMSTYWPLMTYDHFALTSGYEAALVEAIWGVGFLAGSLVLGIWGGGKRLVILIAAAIGSTGAITIACGLLPSNLFPAFVILAGLQAITSAFFNGPFVAVIQRLIAPEKLGRVLALTNSVMSLAAPVGLAICGPIAEVTGVAWMFVICGVAMCAVVLIGLIPPSIRALDHKANSSGEVLAQDLVQ